QEQQLEKLNSVIENTLKHFSEEFAQQYKKAFDSLDAEIPTEKLEASINKIIRDKTAAYSDFISKNKDYAGVEGTEDNWLKRDLGFMTCALRKSLLPKRQRAAASFGAKTTLSP
ncbi:MAG: hypothetical protein K2N36_06675, partial [Ruminiclostridium sp.]|nr:hypothetical protein [Ruminiclostridium sp.]